jgi:hypothetical protein
MMLLNCTHCDDLVALTDKPRSCVCGRSTGRMEGSQSPVISGTARLAEIPWEDYDGAASGEWRRWRLLPRKRSG